MEFKKGEVVYEIGKKEEKGKEEKKGEKTFTIKKRYLLFTVLAGASFLGLVFLTSRKEVKLSSNVDVVSVVRKVNQENKRETQEMVKQLAKQINLLTKEVQKLAEVKSKETATKKSKEQKSLAEVERKLRALEEKEKLKREMQMQKELMRQYLQEVRKREVRTVTLAVEEEKREKPCVKKKSYLHRVYIPTGSVVEGETLHVIPAPVERGTLPLPPVLVKLKGEAVTANGFSVPLNGCYMVGKAQGDWNFIGGKEFTRAEVQLNKLVCVLGNGKVIEKKVNAFVVDRETGMNGLTGKKMDVSGEQIAKFTALNTLSSFFSGLAQSYTETTTTQDGYTYERITKPAKYALFSSLSKSWEKFTKFYEKRLSKVYPVVLVPARKELEVIFLSGVDLGVTDKELTRWGI
jgi:hypothetical protein